MEKKSGYRAWSRIVPSNITTLIERWFASHDGDGEFVCYPRTVPFSVIGPARAFRTTILTTKPLLVARILSHLEPAEDIGMVGRYGLPNETDIAWIRTLIGPSRLAFLGDMDAADLLVYAHLQQHFLPNVISYLGINDHFLGDAPIQFYEPLSFPCSASEQGALSLLQAVLPNIQDVVGSQCTRLLNAGMKIELEALANTRFQTLASVIAELAGKDAGRGEGAEDGTAPV